MIRLLIITLILASQALAQFGQNKVQLVPPDWQFISTPNFNIYFNTGGDSLARFALAVVDSAYQEISRSYHYELPEDDHIPVIVYKSHNEFQTTNISSGLPQESVGGFTEYLKNRVVVPFQGSWEDFRHVIHHELSHAVMLRMIYGENIMSGITRFQLPLWFIEGLAEYESRRGWDRDANMYISDAMLNDYMPPLQYLGGYLVYKGGQSLFCYLEDRYGRAKIGELLNRVRSNRNFNRALYLSLGRDMEELSDDWLQYLRRQYWPQISNRELPGSFAMKLTDHLKDQNFVNTAPAISPTGERVVYLSDRSGYFDVMMIHLDEPEKPVRLISGQTTDRFEELHWLRPGISWSPDSRMITLAAKSSSGDVIHLVDVEKKDVIRTRRPDLDGVYSPTWSPVDSLIAFVGMVDGQTDLYAWNLETDQIYPLTNDVFSDLDPVWSPDGRMLAFVSDRQDQMAQPPAPFGIASHPYHQNDLYIIDVATGTIRRITDTEWNERTPTWINTHQLLHVADRGGVYNFYSIDIDTPDQDSRLLTEVLTGVFQPSISHDTGKLVFSAFNKAGYDLYLIPGAEEWLAQPPRDQLSDQMPFPGDNDLLPATRDTISYGEPDLTGYADYDFTRIRDLTEDDADNAPLYESPDNHHPAGKVDESGVNLDPQRYRVKLTVDEVQALAYYSQYFGLQGSSAIVFSDLLGNHRLYLNLDVYNRIQFTNFQIQYAWLSHRTDYQLGINRNLYYFYAGGDTIYQDNYYGGTLAEAYPFSRYSRVEFSQTLLNVDRGAGNELTGDVDSHGMLIFNHLTSRKFLLPGVRGVFDNIIWGSTGPESGFRGYLDYRLSIPFSLPGANSKFGSQFHTIKLDARKYFRLSGDYQFALRLGAGKSFGQDPQRFFLGGMPNWINYNYKPSSAEAESNMRRQVESLYLSDFVLPLRGARYYEQAGTQYWLTNLEFRFPLLRYLILGWPLSAGFQNVRGVLFLDAGSAWEGKYEPFRNDPDTGEGLYNDLLISYGWGSRLNLGYFLLKIDAAWKLAPDGTPAAPLYLFSLGADL